MKSDKTPTQIPDDIELVPDAWERFKRAVKTVAQHAPVEHPTRHGKSSPTKKRHPSKRGAGGVD
jgi:hypothetical protein